MEYGTHMASHMAPAGAARAAAPCGAVSPVWSIESGLGVNVLGHVAPNAHTNARFGKTTTIRWPQEALT